MPKAERDVARRADELAASGKYYGWLAIEAALGREGYPEATLFFEERATRERIDRMCASARAKQACNA